jgi:glycosyltransferase involved in cell wall biosynthesis
MISILMPLHNGTEFLKSSINSVIDQTYTEWELLIGVNGLSIKKIKKILKIVKKINNNKVNVIIVNEKGKVKTLNKLVKMAQYDIICLLDVDDYWLPTKLEKQIPLIEKFDVIGTDSEYFGTITGTPNLFLGHLHKYMFSFQNPIINSSVMIKRDNVRWENSWEGLDDYNLWIDLLFKQKTFYNVPEILIKHRIHDESYFNNKNNEMSKKLQKDKLIQLKQYQINNLNNYLLKREWALTPTALSEINFDYQEPNTEII